MSDAQSWEADRDRLLDFTRDFPFFNLIGLRVVDMRPGWSQTEITWREDLCQPAGIIHGGMIATLVDTGIAHALLLTDMYRELHAEGHILVSVDLRIKYLRPVSGGTIRCESSIPRLGRHIIHGESIVLNEQGKEVARGDSIYMTVHHERVKSG
ncbi:MAG: PaaI family thioesterase [Pirellulales bacterium]|nr:PaaI family thioesterase [Pirellulales bacterium]